MRRTGVTECFNSRLAGTESKISSCSLSIALFRWNLANTLLSRWASSLLSARRISTFSATESRTVARISFRFSLISSSRRLISASAGFFEVFRIGVQFLSFLSEEIGVVLFCLGETPLESNGLQMIQSLEWRLNPVNRRYFGRKAEKNDQRLDRQSPHHYP
jgi:hypothetical protein